MNKAHVRALSLAALLSTPSLAQADGFGQKSQLIVGAERLSGFYSYKIATEVNGQNNQKIDVDVSGSQVSLLWGSSTASTGSVLPVNPASIPRVGADYMFTDLISFGGSVGWFSASSSTKSQGVSVDNPDYSGFALAPRVGFMLRLADNIAFWPRVGLTYVAISVEDNTGNTTGQNKYTGVALTGEGMFVFTPARGGLGIAVGPILELPMSGTYKSERRNGAVTTTTEVTSKITNFGAVAGLVAAF